MRKPIIFPILERPYEQVLLDKVLTVEDHGFSVDPSEINPILKLWQIMVVIWACKLGKAALFENTGLGKTFQYLEWARLVASHTGRKVLIVTPLAVAYQTIQEAARLGITAIYCRGQEEAESAGAQIIVTNYDMLKAFDGAYFGGVVLDESSILKNYTGKTKQLILEMFAATPYKLACTATPAPNDRLELGNHAQFLDVMDSTDMIQRFFINDTMEAGSYKLLKWADTTGPMGFWTWLSSWAVCISEPADLPGFDNGDFVLPELVIHEEIVSVDHSRAFEKGELVISGKLSATKLQKERAATLEGRVRYAREIYDHVGHEHPHTVIWCERDDEADLLVKLFPDFVEVRGSEKREVKEQKLRDFSEGKYPGIITKAKIAGYGLNWQHAGLHIFVGVSYSFENFYQSIRRSYRYRRIAAVHAYLIYAESEDNVRASLIRKERDYCDMQVKMNEAMRANGLSEAAAHHAKQLEIERDEAHGDDWDVYLNDCVLGMREHLPADSVDLSVFSPPFAELYRYTNKVADMGNVQDMEEFFEQFDYVIAELWRVTKPGRLCVVHCKDLPLYMIRDGAAGLRNFPGELERHFQMYRFDRQGQPTQDINCRYRRWIYHSHVTIWKDPVIEMQRTKNHGLLWTNFMERGEVVRQGMADYLLVFRKWLDLDEMPDKQLHREVYAPGLNGNSREGEHIYIGENPPTSYDSDRDYSIQVWQKYASPVWDDIQQTNVLNGAIARESEDQKHICPLQLDVIARAIDLWSLPGELVLDPFNGVGSTGFKALEMRRRYVGFELKRAYWKVAQKYLTQAADLAKTPTLFDLSVMTESK
jgi:DNA modification methylase/superfamily II DNA or RNA helicase